VSSGLSTLRAVKRIKKEEAKRREEKRRGDDDDDYGFI